MVQKSEPVFGRLIDKFIAVFPYQSRDDLPTEIDKHYRLTSKLLYPKSWHFTFDEFQLQPGSSKNSRSKRLFSPRLSSQGRAKSPHRVTPQTKHSLFWLPFRNPALQKNCIRRTCRFRKWLNLRWHSSLKTRIDHEATTFIGVWSRC